jgi:hypothetical protein
MPIRVPLAQGQVTGAVAAMLVAPGKRTTRKRRTKKTAVKRRPAKRRASATKNRGKAPAKGSTAMKRRMAKVRAARKR